VTVARLLAFALVVSTPLALPAQSFSGFVKDSENGLGVAHLWVTLRATGAARVESEGWTDSSGHFTLPATHSLYRATFAMPNGIPLSIDSLTVVSATPAQPREFALPVAVAEREHMYFDFEVDRVVTVGRRVPPNYPREVSPERRDGQVLIQIAIDSTGAPVLASFVVLRTPGAEFTQAVRDAVQYWSFAPAVKKGRAVRQLVQIPFEFYR